MQLHGNEVYAVSKQQKICGFKAAELIYTNFRQQHIPIDKSHSLEYN